VLNRRRYRSPDTGTVYQGIEEVNYLIYCYLHQVPTARKKASPGAAGEPSALITPRATSVVTTTYPVWTQGLEGRRRGDLPDGEAGEQVLSA
jgi:hypothetical protein